MATIDQCPLCAGRDVRPLNRVGPRCLVGDYHITTGDVDNVWCTRCGLGWNRKMPTERELAALYAGYTKKTSSEEEDDLLFGTSEADVETLTASQARFLAEHAGGAKGRVLDIGCGKGAFLKSFKALCPGWHYVGVEPSRDEAALARRDSDLEVHEGMFGTVPLERDGFDLVTIMHVLEHVSRPADVVREMRDVIKPGGLLFIEVPNTLDLNMFYDLLLFEHLYHFPPETLAWLLAREGFDIVTHQHSTPYGAQRLVARKAAAVSQAADWPAVRVAEGFAAWSRLWESMTALAARGASYAAEGRRVALFGAGMTAATWLVYTALHDAPLVGLFDESPWKIGRTLFDRAIFPLADLARLQPDVILVATMPNSQRLVMQKLAAVCPSGTDLLGFETGAAAG